jgi:hypothetical protein
MKMKTFIKYFSDNGELLFGPCEANYIPHLKSLVSLSNRIKEIRGFVGLVNTEVFYDTGYEPFTTVNVTLHNVFVFLIKDEEKK